MFQDESREIASEYKGGLDRYSNITTEMDQVSLKDEPTYDFSSSLNDTILNAPVLQHQQLPSQPFVAGTMDQYQSTLQSMPNQAQLQHQRHGSTTSDSTFSTHTLGGVSSYSNGDQSLSSTGEAREALTDPQELLFMQVFVEEVGIWMDSLDGDKHVSTAPRLVHQALINGSSLGCFPMSPCKIPCFSMPFFPVALDI